MFDEPIDELLQRAAHGDEGAQERVDEWIATQLGDLLPVAPARAQGILPRKAASPG